MQPDICVISDLSILVYKGCLGTPDIVVEILSPGNNVTELKNKYKIFEETGIKEYWVVSPQDKSFLVYTLIDGKFQPSRTMVAGDIVKSGVPDGFTVNLEEMFSQLD